MVFEWLFGERKKPEANVTEVTGLLARAEEATLIRDAQRGEALCREIIKKAPGNADAWNMLGVNLIRKNMSDAKIRTEAVIAWMRALALRPGDARAADHLRAEIQYPEDLIPHLAAWLSDSAHGEDAVAILAQIGSKARSYLQTLANAAGMQGDRARLLLAGLRESGD